MAPTKGLGKVFIFAFFANKKHFFIILKCSLNGDIDFEKEHILDFTEKMFGHDEIKKNIFSVFLSNFRKDNTK